jgi:hypothetical protein
MPTLEDDSRLYGYYETAVQRYSQAVSDLTRAVGSTAEYSRLLALCEEAHDDCEATREALRLGSSNKVRAHAAGSAA